MQDQNRNSRRDFLKKAAYTAPILLALPAAPSLARPGSVPGIKTISGPSGQYRSHNG